MFPSRVITNSSNKIRSIGLRFVRESPIVTSFFFQNEENERKSNVNYIKRPIGVNKSRMRLTNNLK